MGISLDTSEGKMYWTDFRAGTINRANLNGSNVEEVLTGLTNPRDIELDPNGGKMYIADHSDGIFTANLDGSGLMHLASGPYDSGADRLALDLDDQMVYWTSAGMISRVRFDGSDYTPGVIMPGPDGAWGVAVLPEPTSLTLLASLVLALRRRRCAP